MRKKIFYFIFIFCFIISFFTTYSLADDIDNEQIDVFSEIETSSKSISAIKEPNTNSRSCVIIDRNSNIILYGKNENTERKMASTTKIMTATIILENCNLKDSIEVSKKAAGTGGSRLGLKVGDKITINDLLYGLMLRSGNDCAVALAEYAGGSIEGFAKLMNNKALELGLEHTHFETPHGLDSDSHYTTAYELALLTNYALKNGTFSKIVKTKTCSISINGAPRTISNTNELLENFEGIYGVKTGFTNGANRCLVTACKRGNIDIICVVLGADTKKFRTQDSVKLINYIYQNFQQYNLRDYINNEFEKWKTENAKNFYINKGITNNIDLKLDDITIDTIPIRKDLINTINCEIVCQTYFNAPLYNNSIIGFMHIYNKNTDIMKLNIYTNSYINKKTINFYLNYFIKNFFNIQKINLF